MNYSIDLTGKVALITGASRGIGRECAVALAQHGASLGLNYLTRREAAEDLVAEIGHERAVAIGGDVGDADDARDLVERTVERFGRIDIVVNNAATYALNPFDSGNYEAWVNNWHRTIEVNLFGAANVAFVAMAHMRGNGGGKIINIASRAAFRGEIEFPDYGASKAAMVNLTKSIARAAAKDGIVAMCVAPGFVDTDMAASDLESHGAEIVAGIPMGRVATVHDVAAVVLFLSSGLADYLTGGTIDVNGASYVR